MKKEKEGKLKEKEKPLRSASPSLADPGMLLTVFSHPWVLCPGYFTSITGASIHSQERSFHLFNMAWLYGFFFLSFIFIFIDKPSSKYWVARPKLLCSTGWIFFLFWEWVKAFKVESPPPCSPSQNPDYRSISFIPWSVISWELRNTP